jgi:hypothetical protein
MSVWRLHNLRGLSSSICFLFWAGAKGAQEVVLEKGFARTRNAFVTMDITEGIVQF